MTRSFRGLGGPRIDHFQSSGLKWARISRSNHEMVLCCCRSNVSVSLPCRPSGQSAAGHQLRVKLRGTYVKGQNASVKVRKNFTFKAIV
ncbi:hypothetical protein EV561_115146 [Rhizobium sp. BK376]|nr:hypothetical protein EV561_115146 [Rhizobium sp. BK376]